MLFQHKVPRYIAFVNKLAHTPTHRVAKFKRRDDIAISPRAGDLQPPWS